MRKEKLLLLITISTKVTIAHPSPRTDHKQNVEFHHVDTIGMKLSLNDCSRKSYLDLTLNFLLFGIKRFGYRDPTL